MPSGFRAEKARVRLGMPNTPSPGFGISIPLGVLLHGALLAGLLHSSVTLRPDRLPALDSTRIRLFAPPAAALREGNPEAQPDPEDRARTARETLVRRATPVFAPTDLPRLMEQIQLPAAFGAEHGIPEGMFDGFEFGKPEGVVGGLPDGVPGGQIGGLPEKADPVLPPPDEPPAAISMPRPRFPRKALREGLRGRVVLRALITERGAVEVLRVLRSIPGLDEEAIRVVESEWRFRPARRNGRPVASLSDLAVRFTLR